MPDKDLREVGAGRNKLRKHNRQRDTDQGLVKEVAEKLKGGRMGRAARRAKDVVMGPSKITLEEIPLLWMKGPKGKSPRKKANGQDKPQKRGKEDQGQVGDSKKRDEEAKLRRQQRKQEGKRVPLMWAPF